MVNHIMRSPSMPYYTTLQIVVLFASNSHQTLALIIFLGFTLKENKKKRKGND